MHKIKHWYIDAQSPNIDILEKAAEEIRNGKLVAFPTETVYGLGGNALDTAAVKKIFEAKGRPFTNPLIVHVAEVLQIFSIVSEWPNVAEKLAEIYWPGPLTLILNKKNIIPDSVTSNGPTVAVRIPSHPVALKLLLAAGVPVVAPSANRFTAVSPTTAQHVLKGFSNEIDIILDAGPTSIGIESTVLDLTTSTPILWRAGMISKDQLEKEIGPIMTPNQYLLTQPRSPGQHKRHYSPKANILITPFGNRNKLNDIIEQLLTDYGKSSIVGCIVFEAPKIKHKNLYVEIISNKAEGYAEVLYTLLHKMEDLGITYIVIEDVPSESIWDGIRDRIHRAAAR